MKISRKKLIGVVCAYSVALVCGLGGYASQVDAQTAESRAAGRSSIGGENISAERGVIVLSGLVFDDWDLRAALHTARDAAGHRPVIDKLSIEEGGR
jgi:osmotically-inducible protein OsmY